jgi:probable H4MPT-linked C1 transfer pathway protein
MAQAILGLDIGGANLKAATPDKRAISVPFPLWKQPDGLPAALAELVGKFPDAEELAVTMTGELCDCFETKREGVTAILDAVEAVAAGRPAWVWSTDGGFLHPWEARAEARYMKVAGANWHALATFVGRHVHQKGASVLIDVGSTTTDVIPILDGEPVSEGRTDYDRLFAHELLYTGVRRTPLCAILSWKGAAELFATTHDVYLLLGHITEDPDDCDTADGRPANKARARARLARMYCGDAETIPEEHIRALAEGVFEQQRNRIADCIREAEWRLQALRPGAQVGRVVSGSGEFLARAAVGASAPNFLGPEPYSLSYRLGEAVSACAPAYALTQLPNRKRRP